jgi:hypothetical protein
LKDKKLNLAFKFEFLFTIRRAEFHFVCLLAACISYLLSPSTTILNKGKKDQTGDFQDIPVEYLNISKYDS